jgi:CheY-like chemotaxis protein
VTAEFATGPTFFVPHNWSLVVLRWCRSEGAMPGGCRRRIQALCDPMVAQSLWSDIARLNALRRRLHCSQSQLAQMIGVSQSSLSRLFRLPQLPVDSYHFLATSEGISRIELALGMLPMTLPARRKPSGRHKDYEARPATAPDSRSPEEPNADRNMETLEQLGTEAPSTDDASPPVYRLLIAEDDRETVDLYITLFTEEEQRLRYDITVATTANECLQRLRTAEDRGAYDLLVMDLDLGDHADTSGKSLLGHLRRRPRWLPPHLLVVSGVSPHVFRSKLVDLARLNAAYLPKPFDIEELLDSVYALVTGKYLAPKYRHQELGAP